MSMSLIFMMSAAIDEPCLHPLLNFISGYKWYSICIILKFILAGIFFSSFIF